MCIRDSYNGTGVDLNGDGLYNGTGEVPPDVAPDIPPDVAPDVLPDVLPDVPQEFAPDVLPDIAPDVLPDVVPESLPDGIPTEGETLTADSSGVSDEDGMNMTTATYQWYSGGAPVVGATASTYTITNSDTGKLIQVSMTYDDSVGRSTTLLSAPQPWLA